MDDPTATTVNLPAETYGALVGWTHAVLDKRVVLHVQSIEHGGLSAENVRTAHFVMSKNQALLLGNYLLQISGQSPPTTAKHNWLRRLLPR